jgi:beta-galactosidase
MFNMMRLSLALLFLSLVAPAPARTEARGPATHTFGWKGGHFLLDGRPFQIRSGEMHYMRVPREYWRDRLKKMRAMGLNTVCTYAFWNGHEPEPGKFDFSGNNDIAAFIRTAQEEGLWAIVRPGPYGCAEWEWGGYPYWLARIPGLKVRSMDPRFIEACRRYMTALGQQIAPLQITRGGPLIMVQVENEYGSYGNDKVYLRTIRDMITAAGIDVTLYTSDGYSDSMLQGGTLPEILSVVNFGDEPDKAFAQLAKYRQDEPKMCGEFYPGWFDSWRQPHQVTTTDDKVRTLEWMASRGISYNIYMFHGGTTFGFMNGANWVKGEQWPQTTSYDYSCTLDEAGRPTDKFWAFRKVIEKYLPKGESIPPLPAPNLILEIPPVRLTETAALFDNLPQPVRARKPRSFEDLGQAYGFVLYRTNVAEGGKGGLQLADLQDRALVFVNGLRVGIADRTIRTDSVKVEVPERGRLDVLVENLGRINYSQKMVDERKGFTTATLDGRELLDWQMFGLPLQSVAGLAFGRAHSSGPAFYRGVFELSRTGDTFLDMRSWTKGVAWINGHDLGRYWRVGPQQALYVPGPWLRVGRNEIVVFEVEQVSEPSVQGMKEHVWEVRGEVGNRE